MSAASPLAGMLRRGDGRAVAPPAPAPAPSAPVVTPGRLLGSAPSFVRSSSPSGGRPNKYGGKCADCGQWVEAGAGLLRKADDKWLVAHSVCPLPLPREEAPEAIEAPTLGIWPGIYTVEDENGGHMTFKVILQASDDDFAPGELLVKYLSGSDNYNDYTGCAFIKGNSIRVWKSFRGGPVERFARIFEADPEAALESKHCARCGERLTHPDSVKRGFGPDCAKRGFQ